MEKVGRVGILRSDACIRMTMRESHGMFFGGGERTVEDDFLCHWDVSVSQASHDMSMMKSGKVDIWKLASGGAGRSRFLACQKGHWPTANLIGEIH